MRFYLSSASQIIYVLLASLSNQTANIRTKVTLRRVRETTVAVEKQ